MGLILMVMWGFIHIFGDRAPTHFFVRNSIVNSISNEYVIIIFTSNRDRRFMFLLFTEVTLSWEWRWRW
jgi:hypothetical protein